jgi:hypothetical protein
MLHIWYYRILILSGVSVPAGLLLGFRDLLPYLASQRSGVIVRRGYAGTKILRADDAERFGRLLNNRKKGMALGFGLAAAAAVLFTVMIWGLIRH